MSIMIRFVLVACMSITLVGAALAGGHGKAAPDGKAVYDAHCAACHKGGFGGFFTGAPKTGKKKDWAALLPKGVEALTQATIAGTEKMPERGQCPDCTDAEIRAAVEYMVAQVED